ncbi:MAG: hypothetical protein U9Q81_00260 [Pseudomonadota bacterium]|nr:hypothetical protein [Pseudomonadota bacterium]
MKKLSAVGLTLALIAATAQGAQPPSRDPLFQVAGAFRDAAVHDDHLYLLAGEVAAGQPDVLVLHLGGGKVGQQVSRYTARYAPLALSAAAGWMFLTEGDRGLEVVDIRDSAEPRWAAHVPLEGYSHRAVLRDGTALVASGFGGLHLLDIQNPGRPSLLSSYQAYPPPQNAGEDGTESVGLFAGEDLPESLLPMASPSDESGYFRPDDLPAYEGNEEEITPQDIRDREGVLDVALDGAIAYLAYGSAGIVILDISNPRNPRRIGGYQTEWPAESIAVRDGRAYLTSGVGGLLILDITDPIRPKKLAQLRTRCYPKRLAVRYGFVYLADGLCGDKGLLVIDVQDPATPRVVERLTGRIENVRVLGDRVVSLGVHKARGYSLFSR